MARKAVETGDARGEMSDEIGGQAQTARRMRERGQPFVEPRGQLFERGALDHMVVIGAESGHGAAIERAVAERVRE